ncbi:hypothetical protein [Faecalibacter macacae]|uniref:Phage tail assembly protein n=1 Tax=Faecalibacter macacae TaxID=1859289 RepID=A0A3L9M6J2_9FLAO|nr:hypothetical protein [Faecalibacter macacae]RLZ08598.1 hypothetical protein EAH69_09805 [Faecalibacter macacae]
MSYDLQALKAQHGNKLSELKFTTSEDQELTFVLKKPTRSVIEAIALLKSDSSKTSKASKIMLANCVVAGPMEELEDGEVYATVLEVVGKLFTKASFEVKKL